MTTKYKYIFLEYTYTYHYSGKKFKNNLKCLRKRRHPKITLSKLATLQHTHGDFNLLVTTNFKYHLLRISMKFN